MPTIKNVKPITVNAYPIEKNNTAIDMLCINGLYNELQNCKFYEYLGECPDGNLEYFFTILDRYYNTILKSDYFGTFADIYSHSYGNDMDKFKVI